MTSMSNTHMSYAELTLPLPEARELWFAKTAQEWKAHYLERHQGLDDRLPSLVDLLRDVNLLTTEQHKLDFQYAVTIFLHGVWTLIREYRQMNAIYRGSPFSSTTASNPNILLQSRHEELVKMLEQFQINTAQSWPQVLSAQENVVLNLLLMNLHVSLEDLQLFSGKEGDEQAKRILPSLQDWARSDGSRRAIWHAGQILRWAKEFPIGHLKDFYAVAVHHAALALWTWGVVTRALQRSAEIPRSFNQGEPVAYLDAQDASQLVSYSIERPAIRGPSKRASGGGRQGAAGSSSGGVHGGPATESLVEEPTACMGVVEEIFWANFLEGHVAPIVENLCHLIKQLGKAAGAVGLG